MGESAGEEGIDVKQLRETVWKPVLIPCTKGDVSLGANQRELGEMVSASPQSRVLVVTYRLVGKLTVHRSVERLGRLTLAYRE